MLTRHTLDIARIQVPAKRHRTRDPAKVEAIAADWMENGQTTPIQCRLDAKATAKDGTERYVLVEGYHRLEAARALGETTILGYLVQARVR